jgi:uncharacterized membrane protein YoaK (UPF0700 family)
MEANVVSQEYQGKPPTTWPESPTRRVVMAMIVIVPFVLGVAWGVVVEHWSVGWTLVLLSFWFEAMVITGTLITIAKRVKRP